MKKTVFFRSTLRQFARSLFLLLLVGVITFAFTSRLGETVLIDQEMGELIQYYRSIGTVSISRPDQYGYNWTRIPDKVIDLLEQSPYVAYVDQRQYTSGVLQDGSYSQNLSVIYSHVIQYGNAAEVNPNDIFFYGIYTTALGGGRYEFTVDEILSGYPIYVAPGKSVYLNADQEAFGDQYTQLKPGGRYLLRGCCEKGSSTQFYDFTWKPLTPDLPWFLAAETDLDLSLPEYARFSSELKQSHDNACALEVVATADMSVIPRFQPGAIDLNGERYYLAEGRWLNYEDHLNGARVVVIDKGLADLNDLALGDTITLKLRDIADLEPNGSRYAKLNGYQNVLQPIGQEEAEFTQTETFEIVGMYEDLSYGTTYRVDPVYIPLSVFPDRFAPAVSSDDFEICSLVLNSPADEETFQETTQQDLARFGYYITFMENNYQSFKNSADGIGAAAKSNVAIFAVILAVCFCLAVFVYFRFRRRDLAISRALGVPAGTCVIGSVLPLALVGGIGIIAGSALAWNYTQSNAEALLAALVEVAQAEGTTATLATNTLITLDLILIVALLVLALLFATVTVKRPVLSQLQGGGNRK